jgi:rod shape-determining protein MreB
MLRLKSAFSDDVAIDLGTANTLVHVAGRGIVLDEPSIVACRTFGGMREWLAVGGAVQPMVERAPEAIETIRPLRDGVIADFLATEEMLRRFIRRTKSMLGFMRPRILISVPAGATPVERRAVYDTALSAGAREVYLVEEPVAAALGAGLPVDEPAASMVVDIGGGTTDIAIMSLGDVVEARSLRCAGNAMDDAIVRHVRRVHQLLVGPANAERIKIETGIALVRDDGDEVEVHVRGRDVRQGKPKEVILGPRDIAEALDAPLKEIADFVQRTLDELPADIAGDVTERGIHLTGGGALLAKLDAEMTRRVGAPFRVPEKPTHCVVRGSAIILDTLGQRAHLLLHP